MDLIRLLGLPLLALFVAASGPISDPWSPWKRALAKQCPERQVELMGDGGYGEFMEAYYLTLRREDQKRLSRLENVDHFCAAERMGWGCDTERFLFAAERLGMLPDVVRYACKTIKCEEGALCSEFPRVHFK